MSERPPIVTILGHVDHGKTTLLDYIRKANVASREHGGITQHIGAYQAQHDGKLITFIDTPGHAAFEKMRSRGARVADIAVLVVAIDDAVMPQTVEAIKHIQAAKVPMIVAVNKCDVFALPSSGDKGKIDSTNPQFRNALEKLKRQLADNKVLIEEYGGDVPIVSLSAKTGEGVDKLLEMILLVSEVNEFKGDASKNPEAVVIEANLDKFKGPIATLLIRDGTLKKGDTVELAGIKSKVRGMFDYNGKSLDKAGPSTPVEVLGLEQVPPVGESSIKEEVQDDMGDLLSRLKGGQTSKLNVVVKADKQGSLEAIVDALNKFNEEGEHVKVISSGTGDITDGDIKMAASTQGSIVIGFNVKVSSSSARIAETEGVLVRTYNIIYELIEELEEVVEGMLKVGALEEVFGTAQIIAEFPYGKNTRIAGCRVLDGQIGRGARLRLVRNDQTVTEMKIKLLKKLKEEVNRVEEGSECGMMFTEEIPFEVGDLIQSFRIL